MNLILRLFSSLKLVPYLLVALVTMAATDLTLGDECSNEQAVFCIVIGLVFGIQAGVILGSPST